MSKRRAGEAWTRVEIAIDEADEEQLDRVSGLLFETGAEGLEVRDEARPIVLIAAFPPDVEPSGLSARVASALDDVVEARVSQDAFEPIDWSSHWKQHFRPLSFGRLWVVPSWLEAPADAEAILSIDPSSAFGTGLHATTALCIERIVERSPIDSILDVGTGTGILALAALRFGCRRAVGVDNDPEALAVADENAKKNGLRERIELAEGLPDGQFAMVVANILAPPLIEMAPILVDRVAPGGTLLLSGVLDSQADRVVEAYVDRGLDRVAVEKREEWVRIELSKPGARSPTIRG
jgi:ribosomal protein L11 methyltransferase